MSRVTEATDRNEKKEKGQKTKEKLLSGKLSGRQSCLGFSEVRAGPGRRVLWEKGNPISREGVLCRLENILMNLYLWVDRW